MKKAPTETEPFSAAYLNCADLLTQFTGLEVRLAWIVRYAPDRMIRRYVQDSLDRYYADFGRGPPDRPHDEEDER